MTQAIIHHEQRFFSALAGDLREQEPLISLAFTNAELEAMNCYCLKFKELVRGGGTPTMEQNTRFMLYQTVCYSEGVAHE